MSILETQLDFWIPILLASLSGLFAALGFSIAEALKPIIEKDESSNEVLKQKAGIITKDEWMEIGSLAVKGMSYSFVMSCIITGLMFIPELNIALGVLFGMVFSVQFTVVTCIFMVIAISLGLHIKAWKEGGLLATIFLTVKTKGVELTEKLSDVVDKTATSVLDTATQQASDIVNDTVKKIEDQIEEGLRSLESEEPTEESLNQELVDKQKQIEELKNQIAELEIQESDQSE